MFDDLNELKTFFCILRAGSLAVAAMSRRSCVSSAKAIHSSRYRSDWMTLWPTWWRIVWISPGPTTPEALTAHAFIRHGRVTSNVRLIHGDGRVASVIGQTRLSANNADAADDWARAGLADIRS